MQRVTQFVHDEDAQDIAEYGLLVAGLGLLVLVGGTSLGSNVYTWFGVVAGRVTSLIGA